MRELEEALRAWRLAEESVRHWENCYDGSRVGTGEIPYAYGQLLAARAEAANTFRRAVLAVGGL